MQANQASYDDECADGPRPPRPEELDDLTELIARCFGFTVVRDSRGRIPREGRRADSRIIVRAGRPVSHIRVAYSDLSLYGCRVKIASIGGVCTDPGYRGKGIAGALLHHCLEEATAAGATLALISGDRTLYRRAHAVPISPTLVAELRRDALPPAPAGWTVRPAGPDDWPSCASLYQAEAVRFLRAGAMFEQALSRHGHHRNVWLVESEGEPVAYLTLSRFWGQQPDEPARRVSEYAGSRSALLGGLPALFAAAGLERIEFGFPAHDRDLAHLLPGWGIALTPTFLPEHTVRLLHLPRLMRRLRPYIAARLPRAVSHGLSFQQTEESCLFALADDRLQLSLPESAALVLGGPDAPRVAGDLGAALSALFPAPFPMPGLNYV